MSAGILVCPRQGKNQFWHRPDTQPTLRLLPGKLLKELHILLLKQKSVGRLDTVIRRQDADRQEIEVAEVVLSCVAPKKTKNCQEQM